MTPSANWPSSTGTGRATSSTPTIPWRPCSDAPPRRSPPGILTMISVASINAIDTGDGLVDARHRRRVRHQPRASRDPGVAAGRAGARRGVLPPSRRPRLRHEAVRGGGGREGLAVSRSCTRTRSCPTHFDRYKHTLGWNTAINKRQFGLPVDGVPVARATTATPTSPTTTGSRSPRAISRSSCTTAAARPTTRRGRGSPGAQDPAPGRPLHLGGAERRQPAEGAALRRATGRRRCARWRGCGAETMLAGHGLPIFGADRVRRRSPTPPSCSSRSRPRRWR